jgi:hypothetical protein
MDILVYLVVFSVIGLLLGRLFAAWCLRINDVISVLEKILKELKDQDRYRD